LVAQEQEKFMQIVQPSLAQVKSNSNLMEQQQNQIATLESKIGQLSALLEEMIAHHPLPTTLKVEIHTIDGKVVEVFDITEKGIGNRSVDISSYSSGLFYYSLILDEAVFETKQMVSKKF